MVDKVINSSDLSVGPESLLELSRSRIYDQDRNNSEANKRKRVKYERESMSSSLEEAITMPYLLTDEQLYRLHIQNYLYHTSIPHGLPPHILHQGEYGLPTPINSDMHVFQSYGYPQSVEPAPKPMVCHLLQPLGSLPQYQEKKKTQNRAKRRCKLCSSHCSYYCEQCSDLSKGKLYCYCNPFTTVRKPCYFLHLGMAVPPRVISPPEENALDQKDTISESDSKNNE